MKYRTVALALLLAASASAQQGDPPPPADPADGAGVPASAAPAAPAPAAAPGAALGKADLRIDTGDNLSPEQMLSESEAALGAMRAALVRANEIRDKARETKDVIRLNCVNEKLTPMKGILKIAEDALTSLQETVATGNLEAARYDYSKIKISHEKVKALLVQALNCVGAESTYSGDTEVGVDVDPDLVGDDPYYGDPRILENPADSTVDPDPTDSDVGEDSVPIDRPPPASPYR